MDWKWLVRWALVSFVLAAVLTLLYNHVILPGREQARRDQEAAATAPADPLVERPAAGTVAAASASAPGGAPAAVGPAFQVRVHYFHGAKRCNTCRAIESGARDAVEQGFPEALLAGRLAFDVQDMDTEAGARLAAELGLSGSGLAVEEFRDGARVRHKVLTRVWDLASDPEGLPAYVRDELAAYLEAAP
jgi:hypothetical protein